ncbi:MAG: hypothetical protein IH628_16770, partial [Proteobacteria bacterium]|nr:hypothetical protein [Pseudomonadota bacterium]
MGRQGAILLGILIAFVLIMAGAAYYSQRTPGTLGSGASTKRFTARSGTERENAVPLAIRKGDVEEKAGAEPLAPVSEGAPVGDIEAVVTEGDGIETPASPAEQLIRSAQRMLEPEQGVTQIEEALSSNTLSPEETARLHAALGQIEIRKSSPDLDTAKAAFEKAMTAAPDLKTRQTVTRDAMRAYL